MKLPKINLAKIVEHHNRIIIFLLGYAIGSVVTTYIFWYYGAL
jgi:hypothetical protein